MPVKSKNTLPLTSRYCDLLYDRKLIRSKCGRRSITFKRLRELSITGKDLNLIVYWGCYSSDRTDIYEQIFYDHLKNFQILTESVLQIPFKLTVLMTDTHARLNGVHDNRINSYYNSVQSMFMSDDVELVKLSELKITNRSSISVDISDVPQFLIDDARKIHGDSECINYALRYLEANLVESSQISARWPNAIFYNHSKFDMSEVLPSLPLIHGYMGPNKVVKKPWFRGS